MGSTEFALEQLQQALDDLARAGYQATAIVTKDARVQRLNGDAAAALPIVRPLRQAAVH